MLSRDNTWLNLGCIHIPFIFLLPVTRINITTRPVTRRWYLTAQDTRFLEGLHPQHCCRLLRTLRFTGYQGPWLETLCRLHKEFHASSDTEGQMH